MNGILKIRTELGWAKQELADYLGVSCRSIFRWERGDVLPSKLALKQILQLERDIISGKVLPSHHQTAQNGKRSRLAAFKDKLYHLLRRSG